MPVTPAAGVLAGGVHYFPLRVYFEDTDFSGVVYHAGYLRFMERARSDLLQLLGIDQQQNFAAGTGVYAVAALSIRYLAPAHMGEALAIETRLVALGAADLTLAQRVCRADGVLTEAEVRIAFLSASGRPKRQPAAWRQLYRQAFSC